MISFSYPSRLIPAAAASQLLKSLASYLVDSSSSLHLETSTEADHTPQLSILNFPPLSNPPPLLDDEPKPPEQSLLHAAFEDWVGRTPDAIALDFVHSLPSSTTAAKHSILTYAALNAAATNLAVHLRECLSIEQRNEDSQRIIPVYMSTSPELYISYLGILKAGCAFCPIPQDAPDQRVREILRDIASPVILGKIPEPSSGPWYPDGTECDTQRQWIDVAAVSKWREFSDSCPVKLSASRSETPEINQDQAAYLLFTSGSTGKPKGVQISHLAVTCSIQSHATSIPLPGASVGDFRWFQFASPTFDPSLMEIFVTLSSGATLCSAERSLTLTDPEATINEARATVMMATPSLAALLRPSRLTTLQSLWTMGEKLNRTVIENFSTKAPGVNGTSGPAKGSSTTLVNAYGPTEGAINCTFLAPVEYFVRGSIIGKPLPTCSMFVLDPDSHIPKALPAGLAGELAIGGPQLSKGYLNRPKETTKSFVLSPDFGYLYRTGDMARIVWDETGCQVLEFLGRLTSDQVKISGRRVELGEIESALAAVGGVTEVVAVVTNRETGQQGSEQIFACIVPSDPSEAQRQKIVRESRESTQRHLSSYMCPSAYIFFDSLPRSSSGKVDRKAVAARLKRGETGEIEFISASESIQTNGNGVRDEWEAGTDPKFSALQRLVVQLLAETTDEDVSVITPQASLYSLGIDSLGAMRFLQKLRDNSIEGLSVVDVLRAETPGTLVSIILQSRQTNHRHDSNGIQLECRPSEDLQQELVSFDSRNRLICAERLGLNESQILMVLPTTATQSGMLASFLHSSSDAMFSTRSYLYHNVLSIAPDVDLDRLRQAWDVATSMYDSFRTVFCWLDDDMAPFAQCFLAPEASLRPDWNMYVSQEETSEDTIKKAIRHAEELINLNTSPWRLSMITSSYNNATLVVSMFHGIFDGGSLQLLLEDVSSVYHGRSPAQRTSLEHIVKHHFEADHAATAEFWARHLERYSPVAFPSVTSYRPPPVKVTDAVEVVAHTSYDHLKRQCKKMGSTPLSVLQAAWGSVLLAYTGTQDQDVVMGSVVSGRFDIESETCIGPTFSIVPIRIALGQVTNSTAGIWTNESVARHLTAFNAKTLSHLQPGLGSLAMPDGRLPYDTVLAFQDFNAGSSASALWNTVQRPPMAHDFAVMVEVWPGLDSCLALRATFDNSHLEPESARLMLQQMSDILAFILDNPEGDYQTAASNTSPELKSAFNPNPQVPAEGALIHTRFEEHAESHHDDVALIFKGDLDNEDSPLNISWTYAELDARADSLAEYLVQIYGPLTNSAVPICIDKSPAMYVAILGILKAGGAWCPIDTFSPPQRRHDLVARTGARMLLVSSRDGEQPEGSVPVGVDVVDVSPFAGDFPDGIIPSVKRSEAEKRANPSDMAYLIWTSGTTGAPKGVPIRHFAGVSCMKSLEKEILSDVPGGTVRCLQFSQYAFDVSIQDMFYTWSLGGVLISATREIMLGSFSRLANITKATHAHLTPAFAAGVSRKSCETLRVITMIGEKLTQPVADDWGTDMRAFNTYGPAEVTIVSTSREFGNEHKNVKSANVGWPLDTVSVFVTRNQKMVMKNAVGELALGGPQLSTGYLNQEDITNAKYVWSNEVSQMLYYTGDLVRMLADGSLEYLNRVDDLVKLGGIRVELSEISFSLAGCHLLVENVETLILSRPDRPMQVVVAFICAPNAATSEVASEEELLVLNEAAVEIARAASECAHAVLPGHMIPSVYLVVTHIPRTQSAKTDRRALQGAYATVDIQSWESKVNPENSDTDSEHDGTETADVKRIVEIVASLANISSSLVTKVTRLTSLGIDSIRAIRLASRLNEAGYKFSVADVIHCVTVRDLVSLAASSLEEKESIDGFDLCGFDRHWHEATASKVQNDFFVVRATPIQESLLSEAMGTYNMYWSNHFFSLDVSVDLQRLEQAWLAVCQKTEALRTGFIPLAEVDGGSDTNGQDFSILQLIYSRPLLDLKSYQCTEEDFAELLERRIQAIMAKHQGSYFRCPPWAVSMLEKEDERIMVLTIHHSLHDGPSISFLMDDVQAAYNSQLSERHQLRDALAVILPTKTRIEATRHFWKTELARFSELDVPVWPDLTGRRVAPGSAQPRKLISKELLMTEPVEKLQSIAAELGVSSIASILRAAWGCVSLNYLGAAATVFGETLSDRVLHANLEDSVGPLISVVPVPFHPTGTVRELLTEQHRLSVQSRKYRHIHAREIRRILNRPRGQALYPGLFTFHSTNDNNERYPGSRFWTELEDQVGLHVEHPIAFNVSQNKDGGIVLEVSADNSVMSQEHLAMYLRQIDAFVSAMLSYPDEQVTDLVNRLPADLLSVSNQDVSEDILKSVSTSPTYWLEFHAEGHPEWTAVEVASAITEIGIEKQVMTYASLNAAANRVAAFIASFGFENRMIALCAGRNLASYPIIVGIFKSGNAYLPIDEGLPNERKAFLIEDGNCPLVFTESAFSATFSDVPDSCQVICFDEPGLQESLDDMPCDNGQYPSNPDDIAYLLYTSGSTGKPKGVMVTRANLSSFIESFSEFVCRVAPVTLELGGTGRYLAQASRAFDPHLLEMFFPWRHGMATVTGQRMMLLDDLELTLSKWDITHASLVPSLLDQANVDPERCRMLKFMTVGGEKITQKVLDTWGPWPGVALVNAYGPTEATIGCTFALVGKDTTLRNIGRPLTACVGHVFLPGTLKYALRGQTGEICFTGDLVTKGYLNRPDAKGFVTGPRGEKMYRTGDIGRLMTDDSIEYLGRGDDQTKIHGQRLELGEVSEVIRLSSSVGIQVVTMIAKHPSISRTQLISFIARSDARKHAQADDVSFLQSDFATLGKELQDDCKKKLPAYMVPEIILPITFIPLAPLSGKANIKELQAFFASIPLSNILQGNNSSTAKKADFTLDNRPLTEDEEAVVKEICSVVSTDRSVIGHLTNIFEVGLDSLSAISLSVKLRNIGYDVTVAQVMSNPVVEQLARLPRNSGSVNGRVDRSELKQKLLELEFRFRSDLPTGVDLSLVFAVRPCLSLQEGLVARSINSEGDQLYVNHVVLRLDEFIDADRLKEAWQVTMDENEILRTSFAPLDGGIVQVIFSKGSHEIQWTEEWFDNLDGAIAGLHSQQEQVAEEIINHISTVPPLRFRLARASEDKRPMAFSISIHHALYDGESLSMLMDDVAARYTKEPVPERGSPAAFVEYVFSQDLEKLKQHWVHSLADCHPTIFRTDRHAMENPKIVHRTLGSKLSDLERRSASLQTTVPSLVQAIFALLLADAVDVSDVTYGLVLSGRAVSVPGAESVLLPCITTIPGRLNTSDLTTVNQVIEATRQSTARSLEFQHTSLRHIQNWLRSENPLFDCLFSYVRAMRPPKHDLWKELDSHMPADYPLAVEVEADNAVDQIHVHCHFTPSFGPSYRAQEFLEKMDLVLSSIVSGEDMLLENFSLSQFDSRGSSPASGSEWDEKIWLTTETQIRELVADFCGLELKHVSKGASFLSLGVDSVTAIQFARKLRESGFVVSSSDVMRFACVGALARHIGQLASKAETQETLESAPAGSKLDAYRSGIRPLSSEDSILAMFECTPLQSGMITQTLGSVGRVYVHPHIVRLSDSVDTSLLKDALSQVIKENDILRTSFHSIRELGFSWVGAVHTSPPLEWTEIDLPSHADILGEIARLFQFEEESAFEIPPLRAILVNRPDSRFLAIVMHHALYDGISAPFIFEDLAMIYQGVSPPTRPQFSDTVQHVLGSHSKACEFWTRKLLGYNVVEIPPLLESESTDRMLLAEHRIDLDIFKVVENCKAMEVTVQSVALLAYAKVLACLIGRRDVVFGHVLAGRSLPIPGVERTIGPLFNTVAQRITFEPKFLSNKSMALQLQQINTDAQDYQHAPLRVVQNMLRQADGLKSASLFDTLFVFQKTADLTKTVLDDQKIWTLYETPDFAAEAEHKLNIEVDHAQDGIVVRATCKGAYLSQHMLNKVITDFCVAFQDIIEHPTRCATVFPDELGGLPLRLSGSHPPKSISQVADAPLHEHVVRQILAEISGVPLESINTDTSIFSIGLDSLSAIRIAAVCRSKGLKTGVADILQGSTLRGISLRIQNAPQQKAQPRGPLLLDYARIEKTVFEQLGQSSESVEAILPCLSGQAFHLASWLKSGRTLFESPWCFASKERIDSERLKDAWFQLRQRHPILRTCFVTVSPSEAVQVVWKRAGNDGDTFKVIDSTTTVEEAAKAQAKEEAMKPSSLFTPPVRLRLLRAKDQDGIVILINHAAYDAWTMPIFISELSRIYQNQEPLDSKPDFPSFVDLSLRTLRGLDEGQYWNSAVGSSLPTIVKSSQGSTASCRPCTDQLFVGVWEKVKNLSQMEITCRAAGLGVQTVVLLAVARCLARLTDTASPTFGLYQTGRSASFAGIERLSGPCLNVTPFTVQNPISDNDQKNLLERAHSIQSSLAERVPYEQSSLRDILFRWAGGKGTKAPLFNTWINLLWMQQGQPSPDGNLNHDLFQPLHIGVPTDFIPSEPVPDPGNSTSVSLLDTSYLPDNNVYIDVGPDANTDSIGFGVRVEGGALSEGEVHNLVTDIAGEIEGIMSLLSTV